ncbi:hypothetical protein Sste5346_002459 [Sporothrix stenoceras]|uniref:Uncharacterized protein n=1 Tax=Sporothrix stenoceras TaxID=5173 RepID=A0ABR3ZJ22_9PEZI
MSGLVPVLRPPPLSPGNKGILLRRAVNISSQQTKLLEEETSWLGSDGKPNVNHKLVPDKVLEQLKKQAVQDKTQSTAPSQRPVTPPLEFDDPVPENPATPKATTPRKSQKELREGIREARALSQAVISPPPRSAGQAIPQLPKDTTSVRTQPNGEKEGGQETAVPASTVVEPQTSTTAPVAAAQVAAAPPVSAPPTAAEVLEVPAQVAAEPIPSIESDGVAAEVQNPDPVQTEEPVAEREPGPQAEAEAVQSNMEPERQPESEAIPEPELIRERSLAQETRSSPPTLQFSRPYSPDWSSVPPSEDIEEGNDEVGSDRDGDVNFNADIRTDEEESGQSADGERTEKDKDELPGLLPPTPHQQQQQTAPPAPSEPPQSVPSRQVYHGRSPELGSSSPAPIDVELPDMLIEGSQLRSHLLRRGTYSDSVGEQPSSSPTPKLPRSSLRRPVLLEQQEESQEQQERQERQGSSERQHPAHIVRPDFGLQEIKDDKDDDIVSEVPETISTNAEAAAKPQPRRRRTKPAVFPPKAPTQTRPPPPPPGVTISRDPRRQPSLTHPPVKAIKKNGIATSDMSTSPIVTPSFQRTETYTHAVAEHRIASVVATPAPVAHAPAPTPIPVAVAVAASSPPVRLPTYNNTPASQQHIHMPMPSNTASPNPNLLRTWMMPFELFTATYPDYRGDLEDFLRACYSLQHSSPSALPSFVFDDIVHTFLDYIEYVQTIASGSPQNLTQWYNLNATNLVHNQNVVTRDNVASILNAYPEEVKAIQTKTPNPNVQADASDAHTQGHVHGSSAKAAPSSSQAEQPSSHESLPPGRPFPFEMGHRPSPVGSSGPSNSILHDLSGYGNSNSTDSGRDSLRARLAQSQSIGLSQNLSQENISESIRHSHAFGPTQSSWESPHVNHHDNRQLPLPSSPVASAAVPAGMDKRAYMLRSLEPVTFTQMQLQPQPQTHMPFTQHLTNYAHEFSIEETPARPVSSARNRGHQQFQEITPQQQPSTTRNQKTPASAATNIRTTSAGTVSAKKSGPLNPTVPNGSSPQQAIVIEEQRDQDVSATFDMTWDEDDEDGDIDFETSFMSVQSAAEARRPPSKPITATTQSSGGGVSKERRRATVAASDIGMLKRITAAEDRDAVATKRVLPASMKRASTDGQPPRKKKKKAAKRLSFANFLEREVGPKPRPA